MSEVARLARAFRSTLSREWLYDADGNVNAEPPKKYSWISEEQWAEFVQRRTTDEFKVSN